MGLLIEGHWKDQWYESSAVALSSGNRHSAATG
jgi:hypothetical protein